MLDKPSWKIEAEKIGESLPEYWALPEVARLLDVSQSYLARLCRDYVVTSRKVGTVRFLKDEQIEILMEKIRKK